ncbi:hypothetical protein Q7C_1739 [Methylophaga frappieri]|uniref:Uncharacterized protein n=1 Tax=Methylophaga frappieri (strain ATCC BAA-2434 / DSM 25690 / JAM7) TaxID=754477 RepID=I1YIY7_METFJ|nr:hypothetical protein Q7C_1739 [Methylophaga frappieri]
MNTKGQFFIIFKREFSPIFQASGSLEKRLPIGQNQRV